MLGAEWFQGCRPRPIRQAAARACEIANAKSSSLIQWPACNTGGRCERLAAQQVAVAAFHGRSLAPGGVPARAMLAEFPDAWPQPRQVCNLASLACAMPTTRPSHSLQHVMHALLGAEPRIGRQRKPVVEQCSIEDWRSPLRCDGVCS